jgi:hypothetical protein
VNEACLEKCHLEDFETEECLCSTFAGLKNGDTFWAAWMYVAVGGGADEASDFFERIVVSAMLLAGMFTFAILVRCSLCAQGLSPLSPPLPLHSPMPL